MDPEKTFVAADIAVATILYRNHRGETRERRILPQLIWYGVTQWHLDPGWMLDAVDVEKGEERTFALKDVLEWR